MRHFYLKCTKIHFRLGSARIHWEGLEHWPNPLAGFRGRLGREAGSRNRGKKRREKGRGVKGRGEGKEYPPD